MTEKELLKKVKGELDDQDFYELMQTYRHMPLIQQEEVCKAFEKVKVYIADVIIAFIRQNLKSLAEVDKGKLKRLVSDHTYKKGKYLTTQCWDEGIKVFAKAIARENPVRVRRRR